MVTVVEIMTTPVFLIAALPLAYLLLRLWWSRKR